MKHISLSSCGLALGFLALTPMIALADIAPDEALPGEGSLTLNMLFGLIALGLVVFGLAIRRRALND